MESQLVLSSVILTAQLPQKGLEHVLFDFVTAVPLLREHPPDSEELLEIIFVTLDCIVLGQVVLIELLDDHQYE